MRRALWDPGPRRPEHLAAAEVGKLRLGDLQGQAGPHIPERVHPNVQPHIPLRNPYDHIQSQMADPHRLPATIPEPSPQQPTCHLSIGPRGAPSSLCPGCALGLECHPTHFSQVPRTRPPLDQSLVPLSVLSSEASCLGFQGCLETPTRYMPAWALAGWLAHWFALTCPQLKTLPRIPTPLKIKSRLFPWAPANLPRRSWPSLPSSLTQPRLQPHQVDREAEEATRSEQNRMIQPGAGTFERGV